MMSDETPILQRIAAIEARQRDYGMHDPSCPRRLTEKAQWRTGAYLIPKECECWLSESSGSSAGDDR